MSSFQAVKQANGNNITMFGTFVEIGGVSLTQNQKQVCKCQIIDDNNEKHGVRLYGTMPGTALLNQRQQFTLSTFQGVYQGATYTGYSGFWNDKVQVAPQNTQQVSQQVSQQPAQPTNYQQLAPRKKEPFNSINISIERQCAFKAACNRAQSTDMEPSKILDLAKQGQYFIETGNNINDLPNPDQSIQENPNYEENPEPIAEDDPIPF